MPRDHTLSVDDWLKAAFRALCRGGLRAVNAEALARDLKVSKGSFYWHFDDVPSLKANMLAHWKERATDQIIGQISSMTDDAEGRLRMLVSIATNDDVAMYGGSAVDGAIREWARHDELAASVVTEVDAKRIDYVAQLFIAIGHPAQEANCRARIFYGAFIGLEALGQTGNSDLRRDMAQILEILL